jgi:hypothetical protein
MKIGRARLLVIMAPKSLFRFETLLCKSHLNGVSARNEQKVHGCIIQTLGNQSWVARVCRKFGLARTDALNASA